MFFPEGVSDPVQAGNPEQAGFWCFASGYCQKMKNLEIKLGVFASDGRPKILVLSLDIKPDIPLPKRGCAGGFEGNGMWCPLEESPEHVAAQAQGLSGHFGMWSLSVLQLMET